MSEFGYPPQNYTPPDYPWEFGSRPPRSELNPYGFWNNDFGGNVNNTEYPNCRFTQPVYLCSLCGENTTPDPEGLLLLSIKVTHFLVFPVCALVMWVVYEKLDVLKTRIYSPLLLFIGIMCLAIGSMAEVDNHAAFANYNACYDSAETMSKFYFYTFVGTGNAMLPIALREKDLPLLRKPSGFYDWYCFVLDWLLIIGTIVTPINWLVLGQVPYTNIFFVFVQCAATLIGVPYIYFNLGPSQMHFNVGFAAYLIAFLGAVPVWAHIKYTGKQWLHAVLATTFACQVLLTFTCVHHVMKATPKTGEATPLV